MSATMYDYNLNLAIGTAGVAFASKTITATKPVTAAGIKVFDLIGSYANALTVPKFVELVPIVGDADNETGLFRIRAWNKITLSGISYWVPRLLVDITATASGGMSAAAVDAATTPYLCDTIALNYGDTNAQVISPSNDVCASLLVHIRGAELVEFNWVQGTGASANFLWRFVDQ